jgi:hypothetical protein
VAIAIAFSPIEIYFSEFAWVNATASDTHVAQEWIESNLGRRMRSEVQENRVPAFLFVLCHFPLARSSPVTYQATLNYISIKNEYNTPVFDLEAGDYLSTSERTIRER